MKNTNDIMPSSTSSSSEAEKINMSETHKTLCNTNEKENKFAPKGDLEIFSSVEGESEEQTKNKISKFLLEKFWSEIKGKKLEGLENMTKEEIEKLLAELVEHERKKIKNLYEEKEKSLKEITDLFANLNDKETFGATAKCDKILVNLFFSDVFFSLFSNTDFIDLLGGEFLKIIRTLGQKTQREVVSVMAKIMKSELGKEKIPLSLPDKFWHYLKTGLSVIREGDWKPAFTLARDSTKFLESFKKFIELCVQKQSREQEEEAEKSNDDVLQKEIGTSSETSSIFVGSKETLDKKWKQELEKKFGKDVEVKEFKAIINLLLERPKLVEFLKKNAESFSEKKRVDFVQVMSKLGEVWEIGGEEKEGPFNVESFIKDLTKKVVDQIQKQLDEEMENRIKTMFGKGLKETNVSEFMKFLASEHPVSHCINIFFHNFNYYNIHHNHIHNFISRGMKSELKKEMIKNVPEDVSDVKVMRDEGQESFKEERK